MSTTTLEAIDQEITGLFKEVSQVMWRRLSPVLGLVTTQHLFRQAASKNVGQFPWLKTIEFTEEGPKFVSTDADRQPTDQVEIRRGLTAVVKTVLDILTVLTGDILTSYLHADVEEFVKRASVRANLVDGGYAPGL